MRSNKLVGYLNIMKKSPLRILLIIVVVIILFSLFAFLGINIAHSKIFSRADYDNYESYKLLYIDIDAQLYPRKQLEIISGDNVLAGYLYGADSEKGLIIVSPGHRDSSDVKLYEIMYFVDNGWMVLCYDYTGCFNSEGRDMVGYIQAPEDLNAVINYVKSEAKFDNIPILLFGHSLGAYASTSVLQYEDDITAVVAASGFDDPKEQWKYSIKRYTGILGPLLEKHAGIYMNLKFGDKVLFSAVDGINSTDIPVLVMSGTDDEFYGGESPIYIKSHIITNSNCRFMLMDKPNHNGHYDYFLTDEALDYIGRVNNDKIEKVDKFLYFEHDTEIMNIINDFFESNI